MHCIIYEIMKVFVIEWRFVWWIGKYWKVLESIVKYCQVYKSNVIESNERY